jgi:hypothetical protein
LGLIWNPEGLFVYSRYKEKIKVMSGGHFDYDQHKLEQIADSIERIIEGNKKEVGDEDRWHEVWDDRIYYHDYPDEVIEKFKEGVELLRKAQIYAHRIDWLVSCDDGEQTFLERLKEDLDSYEQNRQK